jgi:hypothetical protein
MEPKIRYKYQYYLYILTFGAVGIASVINYLYWGKVLLALRNLIITCVLRHYCHLLYCFLS